MKAFGAAPGLFVIPQSFNSPPCMSILSVLVQEVKGIATVLIPPPINATDASNLPIFWNLDLVIM
jgi:hypothetical protein